MIAFLTGYDPSITDYREKSSFTARLMMSLLYCRLCDVVHSEKKLTLVFEYSDQDLKKYFDSCNGEIDPDIVKV